jgi:hypothetical protein
MSGFFPYLSRGIFGFLDKEYSFLRAQMENYVLTGDALRIDVDKVVSTLNPLVEGNFTQSMLVRYLLRDSINLDIHILHIDRLLRQANYNWPLTPGIWKVPENLEISVNYVLSSE